MPTTGDRIRDVREKKKFTQDYVAVQAKVSKGFLSDVENNKRNPSSQMLLKIANALGASVEYLLTGNVRKSKTVEPVTIPPALSEAASRSNLSFNETLDLLNAYNSVVARRSRESVKEFSVDDWLKFHDKIKATFG